MLVVKDAEVKEAVKKSAPGDAQVAKLADEVDLLEFKGSPGSLTGDAAVKFLEEHVKGEVQWLIDHPLVLGKVTGWIYEVESGKVPPLLPIRNLIIPTDSLAGQASGLRFGHIGMPRLLTSRHCVNFVHLEIHTFHGRSTLSVRETHR